MTFWDFAYRVWGELTVSSGILLFIVIMASIVGVHDVSMAFITRNNAKEFEKNES
jgi:hypothetical protein